MGCGSVPVGTLVGAVVGAFFGGACVGAVLLYNAAPLVVTFALVLCNKRRHRSAFVIDKTRQTAET